MKTRLIAAMGAAMLPAMSLLSSAIAQDDLVGHWSSEGLTMGFMPGGHAVAVTNEKSLPFAVMAYDAADGRITIEDLDGFSQCVGMTAVYAYAIEGDALTVTPVDDPCEARNTGEPTTLTRVKRPAEE
jgi:hypothetical protein